MDFIEAMDYAGFDVDKAAEAMKEREVINIILEEAGLDVEKIQPKP